jgi:hypothetical protein
LELLRDGQGNTINYKLVGDCCPYKSKNGVMGMAMLHEYEITYTDVKGKNRTTSLFFSLFDHENPLIPLGFTAVRWEN